MEGLAPVVMTMGMWWYSQSSFRNASFSNCDVCKITSPVALSFYLYAVFEGVWLARETSRRSLGLRVEGCFLERSTQLWKWQLAMERLPCKGMSTCFWPHTHSPSKAKWAEFNGVVIVLVLTFGEAANLFNLQRSGNRYYLPLTFEPLCFVHLGTIVPAHGYSFSSGIGGPLWGGCGHSSSPEFCIQELLALSSKSSPVTPDSYFL